MTGDRTGPTYEDDAGIGMDANLYGGGFKHFDIDGFRAVVKRQNWKDRAKVQLWIKGGEEGIDDEPSALVKLGRREADRPRPDVDPPKAKSRSKKRHGRGRAG